MNLFSCSAPLKMKNFHPWNCVLFLTKKGVSYSRPNSGTGMPSTERFQARPTWAYLESCPLREITSFELDSSRSRKSIVKLIKSHTSFRNDRIKAKSGVRYKPGFAGFGD